MKTVIIRIKIIIIDINTAINDYLQSNENS